MDYLKQPQTNRLEHVDIAKGIAMICIILGHLGEASINRVVFTFHVPIFFFITGYFLSTRKTTLELVKNKARTLLVPYLITCLALIAIGTIIGATEGNAFSELRDWTYATIYGSGDTYTTPFYIKGIGAIWFLWATFWGSLFLKISLKFNRIVRVLFIFALFFAGYYSKALLFWFPLSIQAGACAALFMYFGFLLHSSEDLINRLSTEVKAAAAVFALIVWIFFMIDFRSFWIVHCNFGRGIIDIFGSFCACWIFMLICKFISMKMHPLGRFFAYFGRYSLLVLFVHIIEKSFLMWWPYTDPLIALGFPAEGRIYLIIAGKLLLDLLGAFLLSKIPFVRKAFGYRD